MAMDFPGGKEPASQCRLGITLFDPWVGKIPWSRKWQPTPVFLPGESRGRRSLAGYSPWGHRESDMTERLSIQQVARMRSLMSIGLLAICVFVSIIDHTMNSLQIANDYRGF